MPFFLFEKKFNMKPEVSLLSTENYPNKRFILHDEDLLSSFHCSYVKLCAIWYHLYNFKNVKNTCREVLLLVKLKAKAKNFTKSNTPPLVFFTFFTLYKRYQIAQSVSHTLFISFLVYLDWTNIVIWNE